MRAKIARFYGFSHKEMESLTVKDFFDYTIAMEVLYSEEQLGKLEVEFAPHLKKEKRTETIRKHKTKIKSLVDRTEGRLATVEDLAKAFARMQQRG